MVWLDPDGVAERIGVSRKTALKLMNEMPHTNIGGSTRKRIRVSEAGLDEWMLSGGSESNRATPTVCRRKTTNTPQGVCGTKRRMPRRSEIRTAGGKD